MIPLAAKVREVWNRLSRLDVAALLLALVGAALFALGRIVTLSGPTGFVQFLAALAAIYLVFRVLGWTRTRLLWSLRNRLIVAYLFIAVVPVLLLLILAVLAAQILYSQLGGYLLYQDLHHRVERIADAAEHLAAAEVGLSPSLNEAEAERMLTAQAHVVYDRDLPGLRIEIAASRQLLERVAPKGSHNFSGIVQEQNELLLLALRAVESPRGVRVISLAVPVAPAFLDGIAPDLGPIQLTLVDRATPGTRGGLVYSSGGVDYTPAGRIGSRRRTLPPAAFWPDPAINGFTKLDAVYLGPGAEMDLNRPVFAVFTARPSRLNARIFSSLGELRGLYFVLFGLVAVVFFLIEIAALITGIVLTRRITKAIAELYQATMYVQARDFTHRVRIERRDQLGVLGESFNQMTGSIGSLIEEQKQRQRLENELSIAREVQAQLFPQNLPRVPGVEIEAICRAARVVSGDYYDFLQLSPTHVAVAIADISGKGISAALLMASLQAALRSQMLTPGSESLSTAELVSRMNKHLVKNTGDDRFATFFLAVYDSSKRLLRYTNAGHLPAICVSNGEAHRLEAGGMVLGVLEDYEYEEGSHVVAPGTVLIGYSDGLVEPENVYGEEFGILRLEQAAIRHQSASPRAMADVLINAAEEWAGAPEQADDMTVVVARLE